MEKYRINSKEYWDERFKSNNWNDCKGTQQTIYFAQLASELFPEWFIKDVCKNKYTFCDIGCAEGDALPVLQRTFPTAKLTGEDFSEEAIARASMKYSDYKFKVSNILSPDKEEIYPVVFTSNTIEHFSNTYQTLIQLEKRSSNYLVLLIPFREDFDIEEHEVIIDSTTIPCKINDSFLVFAKSIYCNSEYYGKEQLMLIYTKNDQIKSTCFLSDVIEGVVNKSHKQLSGDYVKLKNEWQIVNDKLYLENEYNKKLSNDYNEYNKKLSNDYNELKEEWQIINDNLFLAEQQINFLSQQNKTLADENVLFLETKKNELIQSYNLVKQARDAKSHRKLLYLRRIKEQLVTGDKIAKKDFIKYTLNKITKSSRYSCNAMYKFDKLALVERDLAAILENVGDSINREPCKNDVNTKNTRQIFIFCGVPYYDIGGGQRCSQLAKIFNKMGYEVYYYYAFESSESIKYELDMPTIQHKYIDNVSLGEVFENIKQDALLIFEAPYSKFVPFLEKAKQLYIKTIYEHIDNWETSLGSLLYDSKSFSTFIGLSDYLVATSLELVKQLQKYTHKDIQYLPNAVDITMFEPAYTYVKPNDIRIGKQKTLLYFGSLWGEWFDWDIIKNTAMECPDSTFNIIGDFSGIPQIIKLMPKNVYFLGLKKQQELPAYLAFSDIAVLPFKNCEIGKYVSPLKIFEYIAMNKLVLAMPLPDIKEYPNTICSDDYKVWVEYINTEFVLQNVDQFIAENSWYSRCNSLLKLGYLDYLNVTDLQGKNISIIVLNHNNKSVIFRCVDSLLKHRDKYGYQIIVVDNDSTDGSYELLQKKYVGSITLVKNEKNGCSSGRNLGVQYATGDYLAFLDSDQWVVCDRWLDSAIYILINNKGVGAVSWGAGWFDNGLITGPIVDYYPNRGVRSNQLFRDDISYLATSGFVIEKKIFQRLEGFDEKYDPTCYEDTDLSFQVKNIGLKIAYSPYMGIMHLPHQTTNSGSKGHSKLMERNGSYFLEKWKSRNEALLIQAWSHKI